MNEGGLLHWLFTGAIGVGGMIIAGLLNRAVSQMDATVGEHASTLRDHTQKHADCALDLANFKTEVAKEYAKDATIQQSLSRLHERIDEQSRNSDGHFKEIREDIKAILQRVK